MYTSISSLVIFISIIHSLSRNFKCIRLTGVFTWHNRGGTIFGWLTLIWQNWRDPKNFRQRNVKPAKLCHSKIAKRWLFWSYTTRTHQNSVGVFLGRHLHGHVNFSKNPKVFILHTQSRNFWPFCIWKLLMAKGSCLIGVTRVFSYRTSSWSLLVLNRRKSRLQFLGAKFSRKLFAVLVFF